MSFADAGWSRLSSYDAERCQRLASEALSRRRFDRSLFLTEAEYLANPEHRNVNPRPGRNLATQVDLAWVETFLPVAEQLNDLLGTDRVLLDRKFVCGVPTQEVPDWVKERANVRVANLGAYVRPENRDVTYFHGIDFHQDLIDWPGREADFVTLYVYLTETGVDDAPLVVKSGSHALGADVFPHPEAKYAGCQAELLTGPAGTAALWHGCTLHGTMPNRSAKARLSLRYVWAKGPRACGIDDVNRRVRGPLRLVRTRTDMDASGKPKLKDAA